MPTWRAPVPSNAKERIRRSKYFVPAYGLVATPSLSTQVSLQDRLLGHLQNVLPIPHRGNPITIQTYIVTHKDKGVLTGVVGKKDVVIKLPFNAAAVAEEEQNASILQDLASRLSFVPRSIARGQFSNVHYFVEERVSGLPLQDCLQTDGRIRYLGAVEEVLEKLNPPSERRKQLLIDSCYQEEVGRHLQAIFQVIPDHQMQEAVRRFFFAELYGSTVMLGLTHNDLSVSNIFVHENRVSGLIDWGASSAKGIPLMDVFNYLDSAHRACHQEVSLAQSISLLASGRWPVREERDFLHRQYERNGIGEKSQVAFVYLYWLQHVGTGLNYRLSFDVPGIQKNILGVVEELLTMKPTSSRGGRFD
jgi:hypothetical protein